MARKPKAPRAGVYVEAPTPALFRAFLRLATYYATRGPDGTFTIHNESRWSECLASCEAKEI